MGPGVRPDLVVLLSSWLHGYGLDLVFEMKRRKSREGKPGDWMERNPSEVRRAFGIMVESDHQYDGDSVYDEFRNPKTSPLQEAMKAIESGKATVEDAYLFCGRFNERGGLLRECARGEKPYRMIRLRGHNQYAQVIESARRAFSGLPAKAEKARLKIRARMEASRRKNKALSQMGIKTREDEFFFQSNSDAGSLMRADPNQFTEFVPMMNGPFNRQQYWDFFKAISRAFEEWNHNPVTKRIINIMSQYALGRGFSVRCRREDLSDKWAEHCRETRLVYKLRKYWSREYLVNGELLIDLVMWTSIDSSTVYDIVSDIEYPDKVLYYYQMFQSYTQTYAGMAVKGVPGSRESETSKYIIRQIPYDRVVHIKTECFSNEKRGRSVLFSILGWCKRLKDLYNAQVIGEQLRSSFIFDDTIKGGDSDVQSHAAKYAYMPPAGSVFAHNEGIERKPMAPMSGVSVSRDGVGQEILALIATSVGIPKEHLNIMSISGGSRATAIVGSEPFTKVIEDLQQDFEYLITKLIEAWCEQNGHDYKENDWDVIFPSVTRDSTSEVIKNFMTARAAGAFNQRRMATNIANELEAGNYDYDDELDQDKKDGSKVMSAAGGPLPPQGRFGAPPPPPGIGMPAPGQSGAPEKLDGTDSPIHGKGKADIVSQHKNL